MQKTFNFFYAFLLALLGIGVTLMAEEITLTTYYPAPYGAYNDLTVTGNVGIGTTGPTSKLEIFSDNSFGGTLCLSKDSGTSKGMVKFGRNNSGSFQTVAFLNAGSDAGTNTNGYLNINIADSTGTTQNRIKIITDGNVGIGTVSPTAKLDVNGTVNATAYSTGGTAGASGTFTTLDGKTVTVTNGVITSITP